MKKTLLLFAVMLFAGLISAQNPALAVPKFKGIEITGTVDQFGAKLADKGFKYIDKLDAGTCYMGRFAGKDDCFILLIPVENSKDIATVGVMFGLQISEYGDVYSYETWEQLLNDYEGLKRLLTEKYGKPSDENEGFTEDAHFYSSFAKLHAVKDGQCEYYSIWGDSDVDKMEVRLGIAGGKSMGFDCAVIVLGYSNVERTNDSKQEILDDL